MIEEERLAQYFGKKHGAFLYSGTLALELALISSGIKPNDKVIIPNNTCYRVLNTLIKIGCIPIIIKPSNNLVISSFDINEVLKKQKFRCIIAIHQYGIPINIKKIKNTCPPNIIIIEDVAQSWDLLCDGQKIGEHSDQVITSFGKSKPLSLGIGGAIFSNNTNFINLLDKCKSESRYSEIGIYSYLLPKYIKINLDILIKRAIRNIKQQRTIAEIFEKHLPQSKFGWFHRSINDQYSWNRFPIWTDHAQSFLFLKKSLEKFNIEYELPFTMELQNLPILKNKAFFYYDFSKEKKHILLIKTRINNPKTIIKWSQKTIYKKK